jgi:hypothetical protein
MIFIKGVKMTNLFFPRSEAAVPAPLLFTVNQISLLSFFTGFPVGFAMAYINLKRMDNAQGARRLVLGLGIATLALLLIFAFLPVSFSVYSMPVNLLCVLYLNTLMTRELKTYQSRGGQFCSEKVWSGCLPGILGILAWAALAAVILTTLFGIATAFQFHLPGLGI